MKITPIKRKGCKNAGWIWDNDHLNKLIVPLHSGKPMTYVTETVEYKWIEKRGIFVLGYEPDYGLLNTRPLFNGINKPIEIDIGKVTNQVEQKV